MAEPAGSSHSFTWSHHGLFLYDRDYTWPGGGDEYVECGDGEPFGTSSSGDVIFVHPGADVFESVGAPPTVELHDTPPDRPTGASSMAEFDLPLPSGTLMLEPSGGGDVPTPIPLAPGSWRARWCGFNEDDAVEGDRATVPAEGGDRYLLQLWPRSAPAELEVICAARG
jgi:hypothetical protein